MTCEVQGCGEHGTECREPHPVADWTVIYHYCPWHAFIEGFCPRCGEPLAGPLRWNCDACLWPEARRIIA